MRLSMRPTKSAPASASTTSSAPTPTRCLATAVENQIIPLLVWLSSERRCFRSATRITAGTKVTLPGGQVVKARTLTGEPNLLFLRNSLTGTIEVRRRVGVGIELNEALHAN